MELLIRTQDKETLTKVEVLVIEDNMIVDYYRKRIVLGEYKTKERALEILDEIQKLLEPKFILRTEEINKPITEYIYTVEEVKDIKELSTRVYEMPKE